MKSKKFLLGYIMFVLFIGLMITGAMAAKSNEASLNTSDTINISTKEIKNTDQYAEVNIKIPVIEGLANSELQNSINSSFEKDAVNFKVTIENEAMVGYEDAKKGGYPYHTYQAYIEYRVAYNKNNII